MMISYISMKSYTVSYIYEIIYTFLCEIKELLPIHCIYQASKLIRTSASLPAAEVLCSIPARNSSWSMQHIKSKLIHTAHLSHSLASKLIRKRAPLSVAEVLFGIPARNSSWSTLQIQLKLIHTAHLPLRWQEQGLGISGRKSYIRPKLRPWGHGLLNQLQI